jgi:acyl-CoA synthetase (AMP-forming)/AMP-acid ligase II
MHPGAHAEKTPDKPAYVMASSGRTVTYRELDEKSNQGAHLFRSLGLEPGDHIALCMENNAHYFQICWAAQRSGLYYTCISSRLSPPEVAYIVDDCDAKLFIGSKAKRDATEGLIEACPKLVARYLLGDSGDGFENWEEAVAGQPATPIDDEVEGALMLYSSGTTGRPKGVKHPLEMQPLGTPAPLVLGIIAMYQANENSVYLSPPPLYHAAPLGFTMSFLRLGATVIVMEQFDAAGALALIEKHRATHSQWVPTMFVRMLKLPEEERTRHDVSSLTHAIHAAAPCPVPVKEQMIEWWGPVIHEYYAGTEANGFCRIDSHEWLERKGSVGKPLNAVVHILDEETQEELPPGEIGGVYFESNVKYEYHKAPEKTAEAKSKQGYTTLGDVGYVDEDGWLYLTDRKAFMIISGGVNIYPQETENCLITHPKVTDVAVIGVPNEDFGEEVKAVVQPADPAKAGPELAQELIDWCKERISHVKCPRSVDFTEELPRHPTGKLYKRLLKDQYWGKADSSLV